MTAPLVEFSSELKSLRTLGIPNHQNAAGRLLLLLKALAGSDTREAYYGATTRLFGGNAETTAQQKFVYFAAYMRILGDTWNEFVADLTACESIPESTRSKVLKGLSHLHTIVFPEPGNVPNAPRRLTEAEESLLDVAASLMPEGGSISQEDRVQVRDALETFRHSIESDETLPKSVKQALLEISLLAYNALEQFSIFGTKGFKEAYKRMVMELWEVRCAEKKAEQSSWWKNATALIDLIGTIAAKYQDMKPLIEAGTTLYLRGS